MSRTVNVNEEFVVVSKGKEDIGKFAVLGDGGKFDPSVIPVIDELQEQISKEVTERTEGDKALQTNIDTETSARISADQQLQGNIEAEATARDAADKDLEDRLAAEVTARTNGDTQLQANLEAEASTRTTADKDLQDQISKEITARTDGDTALQSSVDKEVVARTDADSKLQSSIDIEVDARTKADQSLQEKIDVLEGKNAFSNVIVNGAIIKADSQEDTIELEAGTNIALTADAGNKKVTIAVTGKVASAEAADTLNGKSASDIIAACSFYMPVGGIIMWSGSASSIPTNWALCNGSNGTPNLFDRMVVCAGNSYAVGATGGEATHLLTISEMPSHNHTVGWWQSGANTVGGAGGVVTDPPNEGYTTGSDIQIGYTGGSQAHNNMPPYYALAYIMRIA